MKPLFHFENLLNTKSLLIVLLYLIKEFVLNPKTPFGFSSVNQS